MASAVPSSGLPRTAGDDAHTEGGRAGRNPQLCLWDTGGYRHQVTLTNSTGDALALECPQRLHGRVEDSIKALRDTGLDRMPLTKFAANQAWLGLVLAGADLPLVWLQLGCLDGELARAEPKALRYRPPQPPSGDGELVPREYVTPPVNRDQLHLMQSLVQAYEIRR